MKWKETGKLLEEKREGLKTTKPERKHDPSHSRCSYFKMTKTNPRPEERVAPLMENREREDRRYQHVHETPSRPSEANIVADDMRPREGKEGKKLCKRRTGNVRIICILVWTRLSGRTLK